MKDINSVVFTSEIFWSKLDDRGTFSILRIGSKLQNGSAIFHMINNPTVKDYERIKGGNKTFVSSAFLDTWEKDDGTSDIVIKSNSYGVDFFPQEKVLPPINTAVILGKVLSYDESMAVIQMTGDRNPKTDQPTIRKVSVKIGDTFKDIINKRIYLSGEIVSIKNGIKSVMAINADYDKICIL
jgi:hypothetical protein